MDPKDTDGMMRGQDGIWFSYAYFYNGQRLAMVWFFDHEGLNKFKTPEPTFFDDAFKVERAA